MSDETPPPLRLKPRARPESPAPAPAPAAPPAIPAEPAAPVESPPPPEVAATESEAPRLRLKPKLSSLAPTPADTPAPVVQPVLVSAPPKIRLKPASPASIATPQTEVSSPAEPSPPPPPVLRQAPAVPAPQPIPTLDKPATPAAPIDSSEAPAAKPDFAGVDSASPRFKTIAPEPPGSKPGDESEEPEDELEDSDDNTPPRPKVPHIRALADVGDDPSTYVAPKPARRPLKSIVAALAVLVIAAGGFVAFRALRKSSAPPAATPAPAAAPVAVAPKTPAPPAAAKTTTAGPTPSATLNELAATPARAIAKAQQVISAQQAAQHDRIDAVVGNDSSPPARATSPATQVPRETVKAPVPVTSTSQLAPGVSATTTARIAGDASPEFRSWVAEARISGIFEGTPPRALINGRMVRGGQVVDEALEITFSRIDSATKMLVFTDRSGATVSRKF